MDQIAKGTNSNFDVIVIGGGFAGGAISRLLAKKGLNVLVLEKGELLQGSSGACAGRVQLIESHPGSYFDLVKRGHHILSNLGQELEIDLEWTKPNHITLFQSDLSGNDMQSSMQMLRAAKFNAEILTPREIGELEPYLDITQIAGGILSEEAHLNPFRLGYGLFNQARRYGAVIKTQTRVTGFKTEAGTITQVDTENGSYSAAWILISCGAWSADLAALAGGLARIRFTQAEAMITEPVSPRLAHHLGVEGFFDGVHGEGKCIKLGAGQHPNGSILISNAIHSPDQISKASTDWGMPALAREFLRYFPALDQVRVVRSWAAPSPFTPDQRPILGRDPAVENMYIAAGFYLALPTIPVLAEIVAEEIISGKDQPEMARFRPDRFTPE